MSEHSTGSCHKDASTVLTSVLLSVFWIESVLNEINRTTVRATCDMRTDILIVCGTASNLLIEELNYTNSNKGNLYLCQMNIKFPIENHNFNLPVFKLDYHREITVLKMTLINYFFGMSEKIVLVFPAHKTIHFAVEKTIQFLL